MKTRIIKSNTGFNKCIIEEVTVSKDLSKDNLRVQLIDSIDGFSVYYSVLLEGQEIIKDYKLNIGDPENTILYSNYTDELFRKHLHRSTSINRLSKDEFKESLHKMEMDNKEKVLKYISFLISPENKEKYLSHCNDFIKQLEKTLPLQQFNTETEIKNKTYNLQIKIESNLQVFYTDEGKNLFCYLVEKYAIDKRVVDYSNIFGWMQENSLIKKNTGIKYKSMIKENKLTTSAYSRMDDFDPRTRSTFNQLKKEFNKLIEDGLKFE